MHDAIADLANLLAPLSGTVADLAYSLTLTAMHSVADAVTGYVEWSPVTGWDVVLHEDSPLWNCAVDGNRVCGPTG